MIPNDTEPRRAMIQYMISGLENEKDLTEWELDFIASIKNQFDRRKNLSDRQCEILEAIYNKYK